MLQMGDGYVPSSVTPKGKEIPQRVTRAMSQVVEEEGHPWDV